MRRFKIGDTVRCIQSDFQELVAGNVYVVSSFNKQVNPEYIGLIGVHGGNPSYSINRFELAESGVSFNAYSKDARKTMGNKHSVEYLLIGLSSEAGEVGDEFKKVYEGKSKKVDKEALRKELGDCLWYLNAIAVSQGITLESVAVENLIKVFSRKETKKFKERLNKIEKKFKGD